MATKNVTSSFKVPWPPSECEYSRTRHNFRYRYQPLQTQSSQIRLLRTSLAAEKPPILDCCVYTFSLDSAPPYVALSYTWGHEDDPVYKICLYKYIYDGWEGGSIQVKRNLYHFLCTFAIDPTNENGVYLWIDQLSINQTDLEEKNYALPLMPDIYQRAHYVITWLGNSADIVEAATEFHTTESADSLIVLLKNRYFKRLWVIQELLLAREVHVLCGTIWLNMREMEQRYCKENKMVSLGTSASESRYFLPIFTVSFIFTFTSPVPVPRLASMPITPISPTRLPDCTRVARPWSYFCTCLKFELGSSPCACAHRRMDAHACNL